MKKFLVLIIFLVAGFSSSASEVKAAVVSRSPSPSPSPTASGTPEPTPAPIPKSDFTQKTEETVGPLEKLLREQKLGPVLPFNPIKYAIRSAVKAGVPPNTIVLLLLLPLIAAFIAGARHIVGLRGFGIFLPAALAVVFLAIGPIIGIGLFILIVMVSTYFRLALRKVRIRLQYLPRMSLILWLVSISVLLILFLAPFLSTSTLTNVSIFPILILTLLAEDFSKVQIGKSARMAVSLATETVILSLISYSFLVMKPIQKFALLNPELLLIFVAVFNIILGKYVGLRVFEYWRYRKLILSK